ASNGRVISSSIPPFRGSRTMQGNGPHLASGSSSLPVLPSTCVIKNNSHMAPSVPREPHKIHSSKDLLDARMDLISMTPSIPVAPSIPAIPSIPVAPMEPIRTADPTAPSNLVKITEITIESQDKSTKNSMEITVEEPIVPTAPTAPTAPSVSKKRSAPDSTRSIGEEPPQKKQKIDNPENISHAGMLVWNDDSGHRKDCKFVEDGINLFNMKIR